MVDRLGLAAVGGQRIRPYHDAHRFRMRVDWALRRIRRNNNPGSPAPSVAITFAPSLE
jgi:hypothetical protein